MDSIRFAGNTRAWLLAGGTQIFRTVAAATAANVGSAAAGWEYTNDDGATCRVTKDIDDAFPVPGSDSIYFISKDFGAVFFSSNALSSAATEKAADAGNGSPAPAGWPAIRRTQPPVGGDQRRRGRFVLLAHDRRLEHVERLDDRQPRSGEPDLRRGRGLQRRDGDRGRIGGHDRRVDRRRELLLRPRPRRCRDTELEDRQPRQRRGRSGRRHGKLVVSTNANVIPDVVAPTGTISGPSSATAGQPTGFAAIVADHAGGSGVDPAGYGWSVAGLPSQSGAAAAFTFPSAGFYTVMLTFRDRAGNSGQATKSVSVTTPVSPPPPALPKFTFPSASKPPVVGGVARRRGAFVVIRVSGSLKPPSGVSRSAACTGRMAVTVSKPKGSKRTLTKGSATLSSTCKYKKTLRVRRTRVGKLKSLKLKVAFRGNAVIRASSFTYTVPVR
jgi:hypothetical protein